MTNFDEAALTWDTPMRCERALEIFVRTVYQGERTIDGRSVPYSLFMAIAQDLPLSGG